jgi:hypothetical protein
LLASRPQEKPSRDHDSSQLNNLINQYPKSKRTL